jgi:hypothetical protein
MQNAPSGHTDSNATLTSPMVCVGVHSIVTASPSLFAKMNRKVTLDASYVYAGRLFPVLEVMGPLLAFCCSMGMSVSVCSSGGCGAVDGASAIVALLVLVLVLVLWVCCSCC